MRALRVERERAEEARLALRETGAVDGSRRIVEREGYVFIPLLDVGVLELPGAVVDVPSMPLLERQPTPFEIIVSRVDVPTPAKERLPRRWELVGDILVLKLDPVLREHEREVARAYADVLGAKTVLEDVEGIGGKYREPRFHTILGGKTVTIHKENGVRYKLDVAKVMFSAGNIHERLRMARVCEPGETVVDMFAGIGYFSLPMAMHSKPAKIYACEISSVAFSYLEANVRLNQAYTIEPLLGDCEAVAPEGVADRVVMGYLWAKDYLGKAMRVVADRGIIHYHEACHKEELDRPAESLKSAARKERRDVRIVATHRVKSYSPNIYHVVVDAEVK